MKRFLAALACIPLTLTSSVFELTPAIAAPTAAAQQAQQQQRAKEQRAKAASYRRYMRLGYAANKQRDYQTAQSSFQAALRIRPGDPYATKALRNVRGFVRRNELIRAANVARQKRADALGQTLQQATAGQDWQCAVAVIDNLTPLLPANSLKRAELLAYRSRLQGLIGAEANVTRWSTICSQASLTAQGR
ncbi:hypothetical protein [Trichocoleus sp. FACHB-262]|uniref:hypothetical protein n=1 Tax=Trichocoleus sp. FACHB-262 TaxID=2692869 RepID=UPI0016835573|nr:hypothetical protein [Trichocoleus sp. FACHB-262]MBD2124482.1 hypothetical protein [Trichocoleus sp. FACHB-262]